MARAHRGGSRQWTSARTEDFDKISKHLWRDKATGIEYGQAHGCPLLGIGTESVRNVSCFFIEGGKLIFLERADLRIASSSSMTAPRARKSSTANHAL